MRPIGVQPPSCSAPGAALTSGCFCTVAGASWLCRMLLAFQTSKEAWQISPRLFNSSVMHPCYLPRRHHAALPQDLRARLLIRPLLHLSGDGSAVLWRPYSVHQDQERMVPRLPYPRHLASADAQWRCRVMCVLQGATDGRGKGIGARDHSTAASPSACAGTHLPRCFD